LDFLRADADRLASVLANEEDDLAAVEDALATALARLPDVAEIDADVAVGSVEPDVAVEAKREITESVERATDEKERREAAVEVIRERVRAAGQAVADQMLRESAGPLFAAQDEVREATAVLVARQSQLDAAQDEYDRVSVEADDVRAAYDDGLRLERERRAREKEARMRWAMRQNRSAIQQLPLAWQEEAYRRWDEKEEEAQAYRLKVERERYGDAPRFDEADSPWRREGSLQ
jgi:hypothetical protein